jgi:hypothetical protein
MAAGLSTTHQLSSALHTSPAFQVATIDTKRSLCKQKEGSPGRILARSSSLTTLTEAEHYPNFGVRIPIDRMEQTAVLESRQPLVWTLSSRENDKLLGVTVEPNTCEIQWGIEEPFRINFPIARRRCRQTSVFPRLA